MSGISTIVEQLTGTSRIPSSARPVTLETKTGPKPKVEPAPKPITPRERLISALDEHERSAWDMSIRARVCSTTAYALLPQLVDAGIARSREIDWHKGTKRVYWRAR